MYEHGHSFASIGRTVGRSRQRIHQIITDYHNLGRYKKGRGKLYENMKNCKICRLPAILLHHIDDDNKNDNPDNLMPLCRNCHVKLHTNKYRKRWSRKFDRCIKCFSTEFKYGAHGLCKHCYGKRYRKPCKPREFTWSLRYEKCIKCSSTKYKHTSHGLCSHCYGERHYNPREFIWSCHYEKCIKCQSTKYKYGSKGLCSYCYHREYLSNKKITN